VRPESPALQLKRMAHFSSEEDVAMVRHVVTNPTALHLHEFFEVVYVEVGRLLHRHGPTWYEVSRGDLYIVNPHIPHGYDLITPPAAQDAPQPDACIWNLLLTEEALAPLISDPVLNSLIGHLTGRGGRGFTNCPPLHLSGQESAIVDRIIKMMWEEYNAKQPGYRTILHGGISIILTLAARKLSWAAGESKTDHRCARVAGIIRYVYEHCHESLRVTDLAREAGWTPGHLNRTFKELTGDTVQEYIGRVRMAKAAHMLLTSDWSVEQIAGQVGYGDARAFRRAFKRYYKDAPGDYRLAKVTS